MSWKALFYMKTCSFLQRRFPIVLSFFFPFSHWRNAPVWISILHLLIRYNFVCEQQKQKACKIIFPCSIKSMYSHRKNSILEKIIILIICLLILFIFTVIEAHPDNSFEDLRLDRPFQGLKKYCDSLVLENMNKKVTM